MEESKVFNSILENEKSEPLKEGCRSASNWGERYTSAYEEFTSKEEFKKVETHARELFRDAAHKLVDEAMWTVSYEEANNVVERMLDVFFDNDVWQDAVNDPID